MMETLALIAGALARAIVGDGDFGVRKVILYPLAALFAAWVGFGTDLWGLLFVAASSVTLIAGYTDWPNKPYMAFRYSALPLVAVVVWSFIHASVRPDMVVWVLACAVSGFVYDIIQNAFKNLSYDIGKLTIDSTRLAELQAGATILGGTAFL